MSKRPKPRRPRWCIRCEDQPARDDAYLCGNCDRLVSEKAAADAAARLADTVSDDEESDERREEAPGVGNEEDEGPAPEAEELSW